jgi:hypothetical protein
MHVDRSTAGFPLLHMLLVSGPSVTAVWLDQAFILRSADGGGIVCLGIGMWCKPLWGSLESQG